MKPEEIEKQLLKEATENEALVVSLKKLGLNPIILEQPLTVNGSDDVKEHFKNFNDVVVVHGQSAQSWDKNNDGFRRTSVIFTNKNTKNLMGYFNDRTKTSTFENILELLQVQALR